MVQVKSFDCDGLKVYYADGTPIDKGYWEARDKAVRLNREEVEKIA